MSSSSFFSLFFLFHGFSFTVIFSLLPSKYSLTSFLSIHGSSPFLSHLQHLDYHRDSYSEGFVDRFLSSRSMVMELFRVRMIERDFKLGGFTEYTVEDMGMGVNCLLIGF